MACSQLCNKTAVSCVPGIVPTNVEWQFVLKCRHGGVQAVGVDQVVHVVEKKLGDMAYILMKHSISGVLNR